MALAPCDHAFSITSSGASHEASSLGGGDTEISAIVSPVEMGSSL